MSTDEPMNKWLSEIGSADTPAPDPAFVEHLDARLRVAHAANVAAGGPRAWWIPALAVTALLVFGLGGTILIQRQDSTAVVMTVASDTSVYFDDGAVAGSAGLVLPEGTRIVVGPAGEAVVDGVILAPGSEAIVVDAQVTLVVIGGDQQPTDPDRSTISVGSDDERANPPPSPTSTRPAPSETTTSSSASGVDSTVGPSAPTSIVTDRSSPEDDGGSTSTAAPASTRPTSTRPASTSVTSVPPTDPGTTATTTTARADQLTLTATEVGDDRLRFEWTIDGDLAPAGWRLRIRRGDREATMLVIRGGDARSATLERVAIVGRTVWVEAVDRSGRTLAVSDPISIG